MHQGNWSCSGCNGPITELPFEPRSTSNLLCKDCHSKTRDNQPKKEMFQGNWSCSGCNGPITQLPFSPRETGNLLCRDCFAKKKG